jgi:hypothetical protein
VARSAWDYPHTRGFEHWEDYCEYKESRAEDYGISGGAGICWWDSQWWYDEWIDVIASEYGYGFREILRLNFVEAYRLRQSANRRKEKSGYVDWCVSESVKSDKDKDDSSRKSKKILKWAYESAENFSKYIRGYCGYDG